MKYRLVIKKLKNGWNWNYYYRKIKLASSAKGYAGPGKAERAFQALIENANPFRSNVMVEIEKPETSRS